MNDNDSVFSDDNNSRQSYDNTSIGLNNDHMAFFNKQNQFQNAKPKFINKQIQQNPPNYLHKPINTPYNAGNTPKRHPKNKAGTIPLM